MESLSTQLVIVMRRDAALMDAVERLVQSPLNSPTASAAWAAITRHSEVGDTITRAVVYEAALYLAMFFHPSRVAALEAAPW